ncbi:Aminomethyltransferase [Pseudovibrio axinellae]|uniref:Aminomethyltransferase n=1 Tax=Pseudovibrio axinellae TaxID=989403 RepID=A0A165VTJ3_9HYPH|nr:sarcosine oxidase subunit alpha family protein [Pseudovibrio axinellae]KZL15421.1 Aminomethyltransferase [Pseudovibrio axinellae]SER55745.1 sarcosine oxidase subunit alpha [Pseudovibrio axinellae]
MNNWRVKGKGRINTNKTVSFTFDGTAYKGYEGDTVASALLANGVHLMGRSFKYHRPRGPVTAGSEEPNALIGTSRAGQGQFEPNTKATTQEIYQGLITTSQNKWPSLNFDIGEINDRLYRLFAAGFYYKTFMWPKSFWDKLYEPVIRATAGLGKAPSHDDPDTYASRYLHTDLLIVGAGPAGLAAALTAMKSGADVVLVDENPELGGSLLFENATTLNDQACDEWLAKAVAELAAAPNVRVLTRATAIGYYHENMVGVAEKLTDHLTRVPDGAPRERMWRIRAKEVILAQGAIERPLVFGNNDRPGVLMASAAQTYLNRFGVKVGDCAAVVTTHDSAWFAAFDLADAGVKIPVIVDLRQDASQDLQRGAAERGIAVRLGHTVATVKGRKRASGITICEVNAGSQSDAVSSIACDTVLMSGGWTPSLHLFSHTKGSLIWDEENEVFLPGEKTERCHIAGAGRGLWGQQQAFDDGKHAALEALSALGQSATPNAVNVRGDRTGTGVVMEELPGAGGGSAPRAFVDFQNDVCAKDIRLAVREGMRSIEHVKRFTTTGMATDQGKLSNMNGLKIAAKQLECPVPAVGLTTFRPPYTPTTFGSFAGYHKGELFEVTRKTNIDSWAEENAAVFESVSLWRRARYFPKVGEDMDAAVLRECRQTRASVGMFDASTLGKIEVVGPDAAEFMNRIYTNPWSKLAPGRCRYGLMLGEDGFIRDDGVIGRISQDRFHVTTTTGGAARVLTMMEHFLQTEWPELDVWLTSTTEQWSTIALNGPNARKVLEPFVTDADLSAEAFPHMALKECLVAGFEARVFRVSFTGELGFEVNVPAEHGRALWELLHEEGQKHGLCVYGTEAMHVMRAEKGYIIVGQETDGTVTPADAGLTWAIGKKKPDFVGKRSLSRPDMLQADRKQLIGLLTEDPNTVLEEGAQIVEVGDTAIPAKMLGHVTSSYWSSALNRSIALALVEGGHHRDGGAVDIPMPGKTHRANVTGTVFYDPEGERLNM